MGDASRLQSVERRLIASFPITIFWQVELSWRPYRWKHVGKAAATARVRRPNLEAAAANTATRYAQSDQFHTFPLVPGLSEQISLRC